MVLRSCGPREHSGTLTGASSCSEHSGSLKVWQTATTQSSQGKKQTKRCGPCDYGCEYSDKAEADYGDVCYDGLELYECMRVWKWTSAQPSSSSYTQCPTQDCVGCKDKDAACFSQHGTYVCTGEQASQSQNLGTALALGS